MPPRWLADRIMVVAVLGFAVWYFLPRPREVVKLGPVRLDTVYAGKEVPVTRHCELESIPWTSFEINPYHIVLENGRDTATIYVAYVPMTREGRRRMEVVSEQTWPLAAKLGYKDNPW